VDLILDYDDMRLLLRDSLLRIRKEDRSLLITYKGPRSPDVAHKEREEMEGELGSKESLLALKMAGVDVDREIKDEEMLLKFLSSKGIKVRVVVKKFRSVIQLDRWKSLVFLDEVEGLGDYVEIEGEDCLEIAKFLNLKDFIKESYAELILRESSGSLLSPEGP